MESPSSSVTYSDVPEGYTVKSSPSTPSYSDVPEGYTVKEPSKESSNKTPSGFPMGNSAPPRKTGESNADYLMRNTYAGNMVTGAEESGVNVMQGARWLGEKLYGKNPHDETEKAAFDATNKKLAGQEGAGVGNAIARFAGDPLNYVAGGAAKSSAKVAGEKLIESGEKLASKQRSGFVKELVSPKQTKAVREAQVPRTTEKGLLKTKSVKPSPLEKQVADEVNKLPVHSGQSLQANYNIITRANVAEAKRLRAALKAKHIPVSFEEVQAASNKLMADLKENIYVTGQGEPVAQKVVGIMQKKVLDLAQRDGEITAANLLEARKAFDAEIKAQKTAKIFDASTESPASIAIQQTRQALNDLIESKVPGEYKASLKKQSLLYRAMDNLEEKAADEGKNAISRAVDKYGKYVPSKNPIAKTVGAVPAAVGAGVYGAGKALTGPTARKLTGTALKKFGEAGENIPPLIPNTGTPLSNVVKQIQP